MSKFKRSSARRPSRPPEWATVFRDGIAPLLLDSQLHALLRGLLSDDLSILQGATTDPTAAPGVSDAPPCGACVLGYAIWRGQAGNPQGDGWSVGDVEDSFAELIANADAALGHVGACRAFFAFVDEVPRHEMRWGLMAEICRALAQRKGGGAA